MTRKQARLPSIRPAVSTLDTRTAQPPAKRAELFYLSQEWRALLGRLIAQRGRTCEKCGASDCRIFGDHIRELQDGGAPLDGANVMLLCGACHSRKTAAERARRMAERHGIGP